VDISAADAVKRGIARMARSTHGPEVLAGPGLFGGMFELQGYRHPVLVSSIDGVGTKLKLAVALDRYDSVGIDIVNHSVNDILTCGASPLFFLDYIAMGKLSAPKVAAIVKGMSMACQEAGCALIGGETAEMPGLYSGADFDLAGCIVGVVEKENVINGQSITPGDVVLGLPSSGLHTNGYSLARRVLGEDSLSLNTFFMPGGTLGHALLEPHRSYYHQLKPLLGIVKGLAHITGGGFEGNIPRILPPQTAVVIDTSAWEVPPLFRLIQGKGCIAPHEMYHVFNMGMGMTVIAAASDSERIIASIPGCLKIGSVIKQDSPARVILK
jgi:phosphoribosylformylglycinamidine cyclo-ligase